MILCRPTAHGSYYVQARGTNDALTMEVLYIIRAVYDNVRDPAAKKRFSRVITAAVASPAGGNIWDVPAESVSIDLGGLHHAD